MRRIFIFSLLALVMAGGVAAADSYRYRGSYNHRGGVHVQRTYPRHSYRSTWRPYARVTVRPRIHVVRRPIYVQRPVIPYRYYNYYQRPAIIVENQPPMAGYYWVAGQWQWNGYEWIWQPGHYEPDPAYGTYGYPQAPGGYYGNGY
jgi:hypothetical protein